MNEICQTVGNLSSVATDVLGAMPGIGTTSCVLFAPSCSYALPFDFAAHVAAMPGASHMADTLGAATCEGAVQGMEAVGAAMTEVTTAWSALPSEIACWAAGPDLCPLLFGF